MYLGQRYFPARARVDASIASCADGASPRAVVAIEVLSGGDRPESIEVTVELRDELGAVVQVTETIGPSETGVSLVPGEGHGLDGDVTCRLVEVDPLWPRGWFR